MITALDISSDIFLLTNHIVIVVSFRAQNYVGLVPTYYQYAAVRLAIRLLQHLL